MSVLCCVSCGTTLSNSPHISPSVPLQRPSPSPVPATPGTVPPLLPAADARLAASASIQRPSSSPVPVTPETVTPILPAADARLAASAPIPLVAGTTWSYTATLQYDSTDPNTQLTFTIIDTVVLIQSNGRLQTAQIERTVTRISGVPPPTLHVAWAGLISQTFWYVQDDSYFYRTPAPNLESLNDQLLYISPVAAQTACWFVSDEGRANYPTCDLDKHHFEKRFVDGGKVYTVADGTTQYCLRIIQTVLRAYREEFLCPGVGLVERHDRIATQQMRGRETVYILYTQKLIAFTRHK